MPTFSEVVRWAGNHPIVVIVSIISLLVFLASILISAMYFGLDLSWIPPLLRGLIGR